MLRRLLMLGCFGVVVLCVAGVGLGYFVALPRFHDAVEDEVGDVVATYVVPEIAGLDVTPEAGTYTLSEAEINEQIGLVGDADLQDVRLAINPEGLALTFGEQGRVITYTAEVAARDGLLVVTGNEVEGVPDWLLSGDDVGAGMTREINAYLARNDLTLTDVTLGEGELTLVTEPG